MMRGSTKFSGLGQAMRRDGRQILNLKVRFFHFNQRYFISKRLEVEKAKGGSIESVYLSFQQHPSENQMGSG